MQVPRESGPDSWTREFAVSIPVLEQSAWNAVRDELSSSLGFLTGDLWSLQFTKFKGSLIATKAAKQQQLISSPADVIFYFRVVSIRLWE